ncbi:MAG TPA: MmcQ/YjbR family DNA-binding protein [Longimicrobium sp.]|nr:MmcQ/YjbR family DNA-binding protein [Longimicrobium sp.]
MITGDEVRRLALSLPGAEERETWGHPTFRVRDRIFATLASDGMSGGVKTTPQEQALLIASDPESFAVADYVGRYGWVSVDLATVDPEVMRGIVVEAWRRTAPKGLVRSHDGGG